jgi:tellurite resistance protein TerC
VLAAAIQRFRLLPYGLAVVLAFVGVKMLLVAVVTIPTGIVLAVIVLVLGIAVWKS